MGGRGGRINPDAIIQQGVRCFNAASTVYEAEYTCTVRNRAGQAEVHTILYVKGGEELAKVHTILYVKGGEELLPAGLCNWLSNFKRLKVTKLLLLFVKTRLCSGCSFVKFLLTVCRKLMVPCT